MLLLFRTGVTGTVDLPPTPAPTLLRPRVLHYWTRKLRRL